MTPVTGNTLPMDMKEHHNKILINSFKDLGIMIEE
jgi:hypothetical protein